MRNILLTLFSLAISISAQELAGLSAEKKITVKYKDTLWSISQSEYGDGNLWKKIYKANSDTIKNPDLIYPGDEIVIPERYETIMPEIKISSQNIKSAQVDTSTQVQNSSIAAVAVSTPTMSLTSLNEKIASRDKEIVVENIKSPRLNEEVPEEMVFSNITNSTIEAPKEYFEGKIKSVIDENDEEKEGLSQEGDQLKLDIKPGRASIGDVFEIYSKMFQKKDRITAQISGRCEVIYVDGQKILCKLIWINGFVERGMLVKKK